MAATPTPPLASATNGSPSSPVHGATQGPRVTRTSSRPGRVPRRHGGGVWFATCLGAVVLVALIVFMLQNTQPVLVSFLDMQATVPLAVALLVAAIGVAVVALVVGRVRAARLRRRPRS